MERRGTFRPYTSSCLIIVVVVVFLDSLGDTHFKSRFLKTLCFTSTSVVIRLCTPYTVRHPSGHVKIEDVKGSVSETRKVVYGTGRNDGCKSRNEHKNKRSPYEGGRVVGRGCVSE